jgi:hypothetical protein
MVSLVGLVVVGASNGVGTDEVVARGVGTRGGGVVVVGGATVVSTTLRKAPAGTINSGASSAVRTMIDLV